MNYPKSLLSIMVCATLIGSNTIARPIKKKIVKKQPTTIKKKTPVKKKQTKTQNVQPNKTINVTVEPSKWFILGQTIAKEQIEYIVSPSFDGRPLDSDHLAAKFEEVCDLNNALRSEEPGTKQYEENFAHLQEFHRGTKQSLSIFIPIEGNDRITKQRNRLIKMVQIIADCFIEAKNCEEASSTLQVKMKEFQEQILSTTSPDEIGYEDGVRHGKWVCMAIMLQSAGGEYEDKVKNAYKTHDESFFTYTEKECAPEEKPEAIAHYFLGVEESLKTLNIDKALKDTPKEKADELRQQYHAALKEAQEKHVVAC